MDLISKGSLCIGGVVGGPDLLPKAVVAALFLEFEEKCVDGRALFLDQR